MPISASWKEGSHFEVKVQDEAIVVEPAAGRLLSAAEAMAYGDVA